MPLDSPYFALVGDRIDVLTQRLNIPLAHSREAGLKYESVIAQEADQLRPINRNFRIWYDPDPKDVLLVLTDPSFHPFQNLPRDGIVHHAMVS
jgi:hypothetical protein